MTLETSAKWLLGWCLGLLAVGALFMWIAVTVKGADVAAALGFMFIIFGLVFLSSWSKVRKRIREIDYEAEARFRASCKETIADIDHTRSVMAAWKPALK